MATIDTSTINGFDSMTAEQKVEALLGIEVPEQVDLSGYVKKDIFDKTASELADAKKTIKAKMSDDEAAAAERDAKWAEMEAKLQKLELEKTESIYKAKYLSMPGFDENLAEDTAKAMAAGNMDKVFENQQKANAAYEKTLRADMMKNNPRPSGSGGDGDEKLANIELAKSIGKAKAESLKAPEDVLKLYL